MLVMESIDGIVKDLREHSLERNESVEQCVRENKEQ